MPDSFAVMELKKVAEQVARGERPEFSVRFILLLYGYERRGRYIVSKINRDLKSLNLGTVPHFDWTFPDGLVTFMPRDEAIRREPGSYQEEVPKAKAERPDGHADSEKEQPRSVDVTILAGKATSQGAIDPTYRIGRLEMANRRPVSVVPDSTVREAITLMLKYDYSQLPVMTGERSVKGLFGWKSYGSRRSLGRDCARASEAMDEVRIVSADESIFRVAALMRDHDCVLVEDAGRTITGIITPYDISVTFGKLGEPFLILEEIENHVRLLIKGRFTKDQLKEARNPSDEDRQIESVTDLTFGEYVRLLENPERWDKLELALDRNTFIKDLEEVRVIRNDVMHFDPEGIDESDVKKLRDFVTFLQRIQKLRTKGEQ